MSNKKDIDVRVFASRKASRSLDSQDELQVVEIIRNRVLPQSKGEYYRVDVKIHRKKDQTPQYLVAYMLRKDIYLAEVVKVNVDADFHERGIMFNYDDSKDKEEEEEEEEEKFSITEEGGYECAYDFIAATPVPDINTAKEAVEYLHNLAISVGLRSKMLLGAEATVANYKKYLTCGLTGFVSIGHGNTNEIVLYDGPLRWNWFDGSSNQAPNQVPNPDLNPEVVYFNSCQVHNDPLKDAVMKAGARTFIGGITNLLIGPSEAVCMCFWSNAMTSLKDMDEALKQCEIDKYPEKGAHGIIGDTGPFPHFKGLVYVKHGRIGSDSEGPDYYLQTFDREYLLEYSDRYLWEPDYYLEFFCRKFVEVTGELDEATKNTIKVKSIKEICVGFIPRTYEIHVVATNYKCGCWSNEQYPIIDFFGENYVPLLASKDPLWKCHVNKLSRLVLDSDDKYTLITGELLDLGEGYAIEAKQVDVDGKKVWLEFTKDGEFVDDEIISVVSGEKNTWEVELDNISGEDDIAVFRVNVNQVFQGATDSIAQINCLWLIDYANTITLEIGDEFGHIRLIKIINGVDVNQLGELLFSRIW